MLLLRIVGMVIVIMSTAMPEWSFGAALQGDQAVARIWSMKGGLPNEQAEREATDATLQNRISDVTYASLAAAATGGTLIPEQIYRITDYRTVHQIRDETSEYHRGPIEPLLVKASTPKTLYSNAISELHPNDIIFYALENWGALYGSETGQIHYREDPDLDIWAHQDWRNWVCRWWETVEGSGVFDSPSGGFAYKDFPMFNPEHLVRGGYSHIHIGDQNWRDPNDKFSTNVVFRGPATKVTMGGGTDPWIFLNPDAIISNISIKDCSSGIVYGTMHAVTFGQNCFDNRFYGDVRETTIGDGCRYNIFRKSISKSMLGSGAESNVFEGDISGCFIMPGISNQVFTDDKVGQIIMSAPTNQ